MEALIQAAGWAGSSLFILAYFLVARKKIPPDGRTNPLLNLLGAAGVGVSLFHAQAWPALVTQICWALIAAWLLSRTLSAKPDPKRPATSGRFWFRRRRIAALPKE